MHATPHLSFTQTHPFYRIYLILDSGVHGTIKHLIDLRHVTKRGNAVRGPKMLNAIAAFFRGLFVRKDDDFKALLISDLGIER